MYLATYQKVNVLRNLSRLFNYWNFNVTHPTWLIRLLILSILAKVSELGTAKDFSLKTNITIFKNMFEFMIKILKT
jgi:hypothetical protein